MGQCGNQVSVPSASLPLGDIRRHANALFLSPTWVAENRPDRDDQVGKCFWELALREHARYNKVNARQLFFPAPVTSFPRAPPLGWSLRRGNEQLFP